MNNKSQSPLDKNSYFRALAAVTIITAASGGLFLIKSMLLNSKATELPPPIELSSPFYKKLAKVRNIPHGTFRYGGSTTFAPLRSPDFVRAIKQAHSLFKINYHEHPLKASGSGTGIEMLLAGQLSFAQSSRPVKTSEFEEAEKRGFTLEQKEVAIDGIAIYVNQSLPIQGLTMSQLRHIFTGKITNWREVGGPDLNITVFSRNLRSGGTVDFLYADVLGKEAFSPTVQEVQNTTESIHKVEQAPGGIGYATASEVVNQKTAKIRPLALAKGESQTFIPPYSVNNRHVVNEDAFVSSSYPITRSLFIVIKKDGSLDEQAGLAYYNLLMTDEGQQYIQKAGFVPIRAVNKVF